jgi:glucose-1-phosphatase
MKHSETNLKNIIFDLGGVLIDLDISRTGHAFGALDIREPVDMSEHERRAKVYSELETGQISPQVFRKAIRNISPVTPSDDAIDAAWNAMLLDFPASRAEVLLSLGKKCRLFLLSNSNAIHHEFYTKRFKRDYGFEMDSLFERAYYSFKMHIKKPDPEIFLKVMAECGLRADETLFIDDSFENIRTAAALGLIVHHIVNGEDVAHLLSSGIWEGL